MMTSSNWNMSALLAIYAGNPPVIGEFPSQRPVTRSFDVFWDLRLNKRLSKRSWGWWYETPSRSLWRNSNVKTFFASMSLFEGKGVQRSPLNSNTELSNFIVYQHRQVVDQTIESPVIWNDMILIWRYSNDHMSDPVPVHSQTTLSKIQGSINAMYYSWEVQWTYLCTCEVTLPQMVIEWRKLDNIYRRFSLPYIRAFRQVRVEFMVICGTASIWQCWYSSGVYLSSVIVKRNCSE